MENSYELFNLIQNAVLNDYYLDLIKMDLLIYETWYIDCIHSIGKDFCYDLINEINFICHIFI